MIDPKIQEIFQAIKNNPNDEIAVELVKAIPDKTPQQKNKKRELLSTPNENGETLLDKAQAKGDEFIMLVGELQLAMAPDFSDLNGEAEDEKDKAAPSAAATAAEAKDSTPFMQAAASGEHEEVMRFLRGGADINEKDSTGKTALMWYAEVETKENLTFVLEAFEGKLTQEDVARFLGWAAKQKNLIAIEAAIDARISVDTKDSEEKTALMYAAVAGHQDVVARLLAADADANAKDTTGKTVLMYAAEGGNEAVVKAIWNAQQPQQKKQRTWKQWFSDGVSSMLDGEGINQKDFDGHTAFTCAAMGEPPSTSVMDYLLSQGADPDPGPGMEAVVKVNVGNRRSGWTALQVATANGQVQVVDYLLNLNVPGEKARVDVNKRNSLGQFPPLFSAANLAQSEIMESLIQAGASRRPINILARKGIQKITPLIACLWGFKAKNKDGTAKEDEATKERRRDCARRLIAAMSQDELQVQSEGNSGDSALLLALEAKEFELAIAILAKSSAAGLRRKGVFVDDEEPVKDGEFLQAVARATVWDKTPLKVAMHFGRVDIVERLLQRGAKPDLLEAPVLIARLKKIVETETKADSSFLENDPLDSQQRTTTRLQQAQNCLRILHGMYPRLVSDPTQKQQQALEQKQEADRAAMPGVDDPDAWEVWDVEQDATVAEDETQQKINALFLAIKGGREADAKLLIDEISADELSVGMGSNSHGRTALIYAAELGQLEILAHLIAKPVSLHTASPDGTSVLGLLCATQENGLLLGGEEEAKLFAVAEAEVKAEKEKALAKARKEEAANLFARFEEAKKVEEESVGDAASQPQTMPKQIERLHQYRACVNSLVATGALNVRHEYSGTDLIHFIRKRDTRTALALIALYPNSSTLAPAQAVSNAQEDGVTADEEKFDGGGSAADGGMPPASQSKADINATTASRETALDVAVSAKNLKVVCALLDKGAKPAKPQDLNSVRWFLSQHRADPRAQRHLSKVDAELVATNTRSVFTSAAVMWNSVAIRSAQQPNAAPAAMAAATQPPAAAATTSSPPVVGGEGSGLN